VRSLIDLNSSKQVWELFGIHPSLYLWITSSGGKLWRWACRNEGKEKLMTAAAGTGEIVVDGVLTQVEAGDMMYAEANLLHGITNTQVAA
jgi:mannose-6-phosphate isomerase-like protein (cupin superfamily)